MTLKPAVAVIGSLLIAGIAAPAAAQQWAAARCDLSTKHYLVNSGVLYLRSATETKFADKRAKDLKDADKVLHEALTTGGQEKNPAAWYYLARYYALQNDLAGADTAFARAQALAPGCKEDISTWRRVLMSSLHPGARSEEHTSELQSRLHLVCRLLLEKKKKQQ